MCELKDVLGVEKALTIEKLTLSIANLKERNFYSEDLQELLNSYVIQLQKELNDYSSKYDSDSCKEQ